MKKILFLLLLFISPLLMGEAPQNLKNFECFEVSPMKFQQEFFYIFSAESVTYYFARDENSVVPPNIGDFDGIVLRIVRHENFNSYVVKGKNGKKYVFRECDNDDMDIPLDEPIIGTPL